MVEVCWYTFSFQESLPVDIISVKQESMVTSYSEQLCTINRLSGILMNHLDKNDDDHGERLCREAARLEVT